MTMDQIFQKFAALFNSNSFRLYMVGGASRDFLLGIPFSDYDFVSDATPDQMKAFLPKADYTFAKYGSVKLYQEDKEIDITTLREESEYLDSRHPSKIVFVKDPSLDVQRRDFTINAIYIDENGQTIDYVNGLSDLHDGIIRLIGDPDKRIKEDPLRILRAERFSKKLGFTIEKETLKAIEENRSLLSKINPEKIKMELSKQ